MNVTSKIIGSELRRIFAALRRPMGWSLIDAFVRLEEREERRSVDTERVEDGGEWRRTSGKSAFGQKLT